MHSLVQSIVFHEETHGFFGGLWKRFEISAVLQKKFKRNMEDRT